MQKPDKTIIGERIRKRREELNISREQLAEMVGITAKFLSDIELGFRGFSLEKLSYFSECLKISTEYILYGNDECINTRIFISSIDKCPISKRKYLLEIIDKIIESYIIEENNQQQIVH